LLTTSRGTALLLVLGEPLRWSAIVGIGTDPLSVSLRSMDRFSSVEHDHPALDIPGQ